ncbi:hypothetical protein K438DRAFT_1480685, partial [Mycena galopus ATCC 62051]
LPRGQACFDCRRRKMKCDGVRPICGQCKRGRREADCEYISGQKRARAEILQESISQVERRIYELENPRPNHQPAAPLQQPYDWATVSRSVSSHSAALYHESTLVDSAPMVMIDEPSNDMVQNLYEFPASAKIRFGFFLNTSRFRKSALLYHPIGHQARPSPALLWAVYLCGLRLSKQPQLIAQEPVFLSRTLSLVANGLAGNHPQKAMHNLQAEILLAYYFLASGRFLEGKYHAAAAVSIALSSGLHLIRSANVLSLVLSPAQDAVEEGERIHACWVVMILDKGWAVVLGENPHLDHQQQNLVVDTPWPLEMHDYEKGQLSRTTRYSNTLHKFVNGIPTSDTGISTIAMFSKATILWERADSLARDWKPGVPLFSTAFRDSFVALDGLVDAFRAGLTPPNNILRPTSAMTRALVVAHSIAHAATIKLQCIPPLLAEPRARQKCLLAAITVLNIIVSVPLEHFGLINPIMGTVWLASCQVLVDEICTL